jgi:putative ABC transport system permease protein
MLKNYLRISFRNLQKHFSYSLINIFGLGLGLATCLLLVTWIRHELSFDTFHEKADRIYRASLEYSFGGQVARTSVSPNALLPAMLSLPEAETGVRVYNASAHNAFIIRYKDNLFQENRFYSADSTFFQVFSFPIVKGNPAKALTQPYSVVVTKSMVKKYFGEEDPMGKVLRINNAQDYVVTGVMEDLPPNSLLQFNFLCSFNSVEGGRTPPIWWSANYQTFVVLQPKASFQSLVDKTNAIVKEAVASDVTGKSDYVKYTFMPLTDIYLHSDFAGEPEVISDIRYIYIFSAVAVLILVIACINYINLATARAADRAKEVGIRKVVGAVRNQLIIQFIGESILITFFAFVFAFFLSQILLPLFNDLTGKHFHGAVLLDPGFMLSSIAILMVIAVLAGSYPALAITAFKPASVLKGNFKSSGRGIWLRKSLVIFQFSISIVLIMGTLIIVKQLAFIQSRNLGYDRENLILLPLDKQTREVFEPLKSELLRSGVAVSVGRGSETPVKILAGYSINANATSEPGIVTAGLIVDEGYVPAAGLEIIEGRNFTKEDVERAKNDTAYSFILNEAALAALYIDPEEAVGKPVTMGGRKGEIIGVVKDFHFSSLHTDISPLVIFSEDQFNKIMIRIPSGDVSSHIEKIKDVYSTLAPSRPFEYEFADEQYTALYDNEQRMGSIFIVFATLAIIIACLGLLGLVAFSAAQKAKEIGIRKVLGATAPNIVLLITRDFTVLIFLAIAIGLPVAYWTMTQWLKGFAYKTDIGIEPLVISSAICIVIALGASGYQAVKAALIDPAKTLRSE